MGKNIPYATIRSFFQDYEFSDDEIELSVCETVTNIKNFVDSHITILDANSGNSLCIPYYNRLLKMYKLLNLNWNENGSNETRKDGHAK